MSDTNEAKQPLPEVAAYFAAVAAAHAAFYEAFNAAEGTLSGVYRSIGYNYCAPEYTAAQSARRDAIGAARAARNTARDTARDVLRDSGNELALHLVDEYLRNYPDETTLLLKSLPLTLAEMDEMGL
jgi:hypothetical protein